MLVSKIFDKPRDFFDWYGWKIRTNINAEEDTHSLIRISDLAYDFLNQNALKCLVRGKKPLFVNAYGYKGGHPNGGEEWGKTEEYESWQNFKPVFEEEFEIVKKDSLTGSVCIKWNNRVALITPETTLNDFIQSHKERLQFRKDLEI